MHAWKWEADCPVRSQSVTGNGEMISVVGRRRWGSLCAGRESYRPFSQALQGKGGGIVGGLRVVWRMQGRVGGSSQAGIRQVAVHVQKGRVVLAVADICKQQPYHSSHKGICNVPNTHTFIISSACVEPLWWQKNILLDVLLCVLLSSHQAWLKTREHAPNGEAMNQFHWELPLGQVARPADGSSS